MVGLEPRRVDLFTQPFRKRQRLVEPDRGALRVAPGDKGGARRGADREGGVGVGEAGTRVG